MTQARTAVRHSEMKNNAHQNRLGSAIRERRKQRGVSLEDAASVAELRPAFLAALSPAVRDKATAAIIRLREQEAALQAQHALTLAATRNATRGLEPTL